MSEGEKRQRNNINQKIKMRISWGSILMVHSLEIEHSPGHLEDSFWRILENNIGNRLLKSENL